MKCWSYCDSMSSRVKNELKSIKLLMRRVAVVYFRMYKVQRQKSTTAEEVARFQHFFPNLG